MQWIRFYKQLRELPLSDQPDDETIADDARCDRWWEQYTRQIQQDAASAARGRPRGGGMDFSEIPQFEG